jgi:hypothetical protein
VAQAALRPDPQAVRKGRLDGLDESGELLKGPAGPGSCVCNYRMWAERWLSSDTISGTSSASAIACG